MTVPAPKKPKLNNKHDDEQCSNRKIANAAMLKPGHVNNENAVSTINFKVGDIVWAKIKGHPHWPAEIKSMPSERFAVVYWFNDYRTTKISRNQLFTFLSNYDNFSSKFDRTVGLKAAATEALIRLGNNLNINSSY